MPMSLAMAHLRLTSSGSLLMERELQSGTLSIGASEVALRFSPSCRCWKQSSRRYPGV